MSGPAGRRAAVWRDESRHACVLGGKHASMPFSDRLEQLACTVGMLTCCLICQPAGLLAMLPLGPTPATQARVPVPLAVLRGAAGRTQRPPQEAMHAHRFEAAGRVTLPPEPARQGSRLHMQQRGRQQPGRRPRQGMRASLAQRLATSLPPLAAAAAGQQMRRFPSRPKAAAMQRRACTAAQPQ